MSANAPEGNVNRKNGSEAAVDSSDKNSGDVDIVFITQVAAMSCAETQHPEITLASQSLRKTGFRSANHVDVVLILGGFREDFSSRAIE
jgi:hypothetical protein